MKRSLLFFLIMSVPALLRADDQIQSAQQALKDQGFYYGQVDGQEGPDTGAALRRYQIRQGLDVTGKLDEQTLESLKLKPGAATANRETIQAVPPPDNVPEEAKPTPAVPPRVVQSDRDFLRRHPEPAPASDEGDATPAPQPPRERVEPPPAAAADDTVEVQDYAGFFRRTPYETAPLPVQRDTVERAQKRLGREGFYRGPVDGQLSDALNRAVAAYQRDADIRVSGRLDGDTLTDMDLMPKRHVVIRPGEDQYRAPYGEPRGVYRGIWVR